MEIGEKCAFLFFHITNVKTIFDTFVYYFPQQPEHIFYFIFVKHY